MMSRSMALRSSVRRAITFTSSSRSITTEASVRDDSDPLPPSMLQKIQPRSDAQPTRIQRAPSCESSKIQPDSFLPIGTDTCVASHVIATIYSFPTMEPQRYQNLPGQLLNMPMRKDILHRAIIYEGDKTRQGTASTKWRDEVHGSGRKIRPQKGSGMARLGDKKSPMLRGGGVAFGPKPRDFSTELQKKVYDKAWRIALSLRYRVGQLKIFEIDREFQPQLPRRRKTGSSADEASWPAKYAYDVLHQIRQLNTGSVPMLVTLGKEPELFGKLEKAVQDKTLPNFPLDWQPLEKVDVKDLLLRSQLYIEKRALDKLWNNHRSDLT